MMVKLPCRFVTPIEIGPLCCFTSFVILCSFSLREATIVILIRFGTTAACNVCVLSIHVLSIRLSGLLLSKGGHEIFSTCNRFSECYRNKPRQDRHDESAQITAAQY